MKTVEGKCIASVQTSAENIEEQIWPLTKSCLYKILLSVGNVRNQQSSAVVSSVLDATAGLRIVLSLSFDKDPKKQKKKSKRIVNAW